MHFVESVLLMPSLTKRVAASNAHQIVPLAQPEEPALNVKKDTSGNTIKIMKFLMMDKDKGLALNA